MLLQRQLYQFPHDGFDELIGVEKEDKGAVQHEYPKAFSPKLRAAFDEWIADRVERKLKSARYTTRGWAGLMKKWGSVPEATAIAAIEAAIANGYMGLWEPKTSLKFPAPPPSTTTPMEMPDEIKANMKRERGRG